MPRTVDEAEFAVRAVLGQQVSTAAARTHAARLVRALGTPIEDPHGDLTHVFPTPQQLAAGLAGLDRTVLALPDRRRHTMTVLAEALADGGLELDTGTDRDRARRQLAALPGIGPWTVEMVAMRALGDPDAFPVADLGVRGAAVALGLAATPAAVGAAAERWRPWRAYAVQHLWALGEHPINQWPPTGTSER